MTTSTDKQRVAAARAMLERCLSGSVRQEEAEAREPWPGASSDDNTYGIPYWIAPRADTKGRVVT